MTGLVPVIHDFTPARWCRPKSWMPAFAGMTGKPLPPQASALTISSVTFLASPNSIMVLGRKNSSFSTPA